MRAWVFDLDGVIWRGDSPIAEGVRGAQHVIAAGLDVLFVTNFSYSRLAAKKPNSPSTPPGSRSRARDHRRGCAELVHRRSRARVRGPGVVAALRARAPGRHRRPMPMSWLCLHP